MKFRICSILLCLICLQLSDSGARAQDDARAAWQVTGYDIDVTKPGADRVLSARAIVSAQNIGRAAGSTLSLRINPKAEIKSITIGSSPATYQSRPETRGNAQRITINLPESIAANGKVTATVEYRLPVADNTGLISISPLGSQFLPSSMWFPLANNAFALRGADYAPFRLTVLAANALSSGADKSANGNSVFEQTLNGQPFFVIGSWDRVDDPSAKGVSAFIATGAGPDDRKQAQALIRLANDVRAFYSTMLGPAPDVPVRLISVTRGGGFDDAGAILLSEGSFQRRKIDAATALTIGEAMARLWIGADTPVRGEGYGVLREGLPRFLATLFVEKEFGAQASEAERARERIAYSAIAKRDGPLSRTTPIDPTYFNSVGNKGAMVWRLVDHLMGRDAFVSALRSMLASGRGETDGLSLARARAALVERGPASLKTVLDQELDQPTDTDLLIGLPHQENGQWVAALRNLGSLDSIVNVAGWTPAGQELIVTTSVPAHDFGQAAFRNVSSITRAEVDVEKYYPQLDYANDVAPPAPEIALSLAEADRLLGAQEFAKSENLARQMLSASPELPDARIVLGRALLAENKNDEAEKEFNQLLSEPLPTAAALAWANIGLGEVALRRGQAAPAARYFTEAIRADAEYAATLTARAARIRAESTGSTTPTVDDSAKSFINQLDTAIRTGRAAEIERFIVPGELTRFRQQIVGTQPEAWQTRVLRTEQLDANRLALDVALNTKQLGVEHSGTAVYILARVGDGWKLNAIELFEVK